MVVQAETCCYLCTVEQVAVLRQTLKGPTKKHGIPIKMYTCSFEWLLEVLAFCSHAIKFNLSEAVVQFCLENPFCCLTISKTANIVIGT